MTERVTFRIDEDRKEEWEDAVEESREYDSLTQLVKLAVHRELNGRPSQEATATETVQSGYSPDVTNGEILQQMQEFHRELKEVGDDVGVVKKEVTKGNVLTARDVFDRLPEKESKAVTPEQLADVIEFTDTEEVTDVLDKLDRETGRVKKTSLAGETHYFKEV